MSRTLPDLSLYLVLGAADTGKRPFEEVVLAAIEGGVTMVQLRDKQATTRVLLEHALRLKALLEPRGVPLIVNDRIDVALAAGAAGVHLGQDDMPPALARRLVGADMLIGLSVSDRVEADTADPETVDYIGIGSVFPTGTKADAGTAIGPAFAAELRQLVDLPSVAIGGLNASNAGQLRGSGIEGLAVVSAICAAADPAQAARELRQTYFG
ncbi:thiamine phosphate synthase [Rhodovibrio sodomensis]|uniref:Thiamine-phosphate synthase n=1 Tax=Rhodovibrio sodomensis TaxID=1088 RepID=A0ABS1DD66_9PROT|nr:thiamine phosphate synthase [Rhodovibrio sodomensis]MBK1668379.1 thiamine phosphate synthase [Rhodovibrio sodomensis]